MDLQRILAQLRGELANLDAAIESLQRLQRTGNRRGRPPSWLGALKKPGRRPRKSKPKRSDGRPEAE
ncbi:MAG TPA: hypothetical protein VKT49_20330 [Bryobacteraceae bacterium]|nr:hypothetical protein [Bryobacteraceae bacterium]